MRKITTRSDGLTIATDTMKDAESVSLNIWVKTGSIYENKRNNGISHVVEHMAFKGTKRRNAKQIAEAFEDMGAYFNAFTSRLNTYYCGKVLSSDLEQCLDILADIIQNSTFDAQELEMERKVILQELAMSKDDPGHIIAELFSLASFGDTAFGRSIIGSRQNISRFTREDLLHYVQEKYCPENMIISAAGKIEHEEFIRLIDQYFTHLHSGKKNQYPMINYLGGEKRKEKKLEQVNMVLGFAGCPIFSDDYYAMDLLSAILGGGLSSRLFQEVREKRGLVYTISAYHTAHRDTGSFKIYAATSPEKCNETLQVVCVELQKIAQEIRPEELKRALTQNRVDLLMGRELSDYRSNKLSSDLSIYGKVLDETEILAKYSAVTLDDLHRVAQQTFSIANAMSFACVGKLKEVMTLNDIKQVLAK